MTEYCTIVDLVSWKYEYYEFIIPLQSGAQFTFLGCYYEFKRLKRGSEQILIIRYYSDDQDKEVVKQKINYSLNILEYIFLIPLKATTWAETNVVDKRTISSEKSVKKLVHLQDLEKKINGLKKSKDNFDNAIRLFGRGFEYSLNPDFQEDSFLNYFKVVENISKSYFNIKENKGCLKIQTSKLSICIKDILKKECNVELSANKLNQVTDIVKKQLLATIKSETFNKISFFCNSHNVKVDYNVLGKAVRLRNKIAHGEEVKISDYQEEYICIFQLSKDMIAKMYFNKTYKQIGVKGKVITYPPTN